MALSAIWADIPGERLVGIGYAVPWLDRFAAGCERAIAFMPAAQGAVHWPAGGPSATALVCDRELPLVDASVDRILMIHALEHSENPHETLAESWRVLAPGGRLMAVIPNRRGLWARLEHTPFGTGRPWSRRQLAGLLRETGFTPERWSDALHFAPFRRASMLRFHPALERAGRRFWPVFSGVIIVEAQKQIYQGIAVTARSSRRVLVPAAATPQGA